MNTSIYYLTIPKYINIITSNKTNREPTATLLNISFIYKKKSICLIKEFFLVNSFIGVFLGILQYVSQQLPRKTLLIFGIFSIIL